MSAFVGGDVQVREEDEPGPEPGILGRDRFLHLQQELRALPHLVDRGNPGAVGLVGGVLELAAQAGVRLDHDLVAAPHELARARRRQCDAVLLGLDLLGDADAHERRNDTRTSSRR